MQLDPAIELLLRCAFLSVFAAAFAHKFLNFESLSQIVAAYMRGTRLAGTAAVRALAVTVMLGEATVVVCCVFPVAGPLRAGAIAGMLLLYAAVMAINLRRGNAVLDCGCSWGRESQPLSYALVVRNMLLALIGLSLAFPSSVRPLQVLDVISISAGAALFVLIYAIFNRMVSRTTMA